MLCAPIQAAPAVQRAGPVPQPSVVPVLLGRARAAAAPGTCAEGAADLRGDQCRALGRAHLIQVPFPNCRHTP